MNSLKKIFICRMPMVKSAYLYKMQKEGWIFERSFLKGAGCYFRKGSSDNLILAIKNKKYSEAEILESNDDMMIYLSTLDSKIIYSDKKFIYYFLEKKENIKFLIKERMKLERTSYKILRFGMSGICWGLLFEVISGNMNAIIMFLPFLLIFLYSHRRIKLLENFGKEMDIWHDDNFLLNNEPE